MRGLIAGFVALLLLPCCAAQGAVVDFNNMNVASVAYGRYHEIYMGTRMQAYKGKIYFEIFDDGTAMPSKVLQYDPTSGLCNAVNHSVLTGTTGKFTGLQTMGGLLYMADSLGNLQTYDGNTLATVTAPFNATNYVYGMTEFNGKKYFGTTTGSVYELNGSTWNPNPVFQASATVVDLCSWRGSLYAAPWAWDGQLYKSDGTNLNNPWQAVISGAYATANGHLLPTANYLYTGVLDNTGGHISTVRRSSDGVNFTTVAGPGPFKWDYGALSHDGIAYFFQNGNAGGLPPTSGYLVTDDGVTATTTSMGDWNWRIRSAVELNGQVYAIGNLLDMNGDVVQDQYLLTTVPEPSTLVLLGMGAIGLLGWAWRRRRA